MGLVEGAQKVHRSRVASTDSGTRPDVAFAASEIQSENGNSGVEFQSAFGQLDGLENSASLVQGFLPLSFRY